MHIVIVGGGPGGLYFALLMKKAWPEHRIEVHERNRSGDTYGFGVVFSDTTLGRFAAYDPESHRGICGQAAYWDAIDVVLHGEAVRSYGHGFCACGRKELLAILEARCRELGVELHFESPVADPRLHMGADLVVGADGMNSRVRETFVDHFRPSFDVRPPPFVWLGSTRPFDAFHFDITSDQHGLWVLGAYQYSATMSTWVIEAPQETWDNARGLLEGMSEAETIAYLERVWADRLEGHKLVGNRSIWRRFPMLRNQRWYHENVVLLGDALHTSHYQVGSGTKLAMEDGIALYESFRAARRVRDALALFEETRRPEVERIQHAADVAVIWTENPSRYLTLDPVQGAFSWFTRAKELSYDELQRRDPAFMSRVDTWFAEKVQRDTGRSPAGDPPPPMFTPFRLRQTTLENRVAVAPMQMGSATDGALGDFHLVHFGGLAMGGAGLVYSETAAVSPEGRLTDGCPGLYRAEHVPSWRRVIDVVHRNSNAKFAVQLGHAGRKAATTSPEAGDRDLIAPSALPFGPGHPVPREVTRADMDRVVADFVRATEMADAAGADVVEIDMAHGHLLSSFITPLANRRTDEYGGSLENRMRFPLEVFDAARAVWPEHKPMSVRISATDWVAGAGISGDDAVRVAAMLKARGCDLVHVSSGMTTADARPASGRMFQVWLSEQVRNDAGIATMAVGNIATADEVNTIVAAGRADLVALGRQHLVNPHFTLAAAASAGFDGQRWPEQYRDSKEHSYRLAARERARMEALRAAVRPRSHRRVEG